MITDDDILAARRRFGLRIRNLRDEQGISQAAFSTMIGMDRGYLSGVETGSRNVSFNNIVRISSGFGMNLSTFFQHVDIEMQAHEEKDPRPEIDPDGQDLPDEQDCS